MSTMTMTKNSTMTLTKTDNGDNKVNQNNGKSDNHKLRLKVMLQHQCPRNT